MIDFDFQVKTKIYFGKGKELQAGSILKGLGVKKSLVIIGQGSIRKSGLLDRVLGTLEKEGVDYLLLEGVRPNPTRQLGDDFITKAREYKPDFVFAIGGGSVMDTAKYVCVGYGYEGNAFDFNLHKASPKTALPLGVILTIAASGSEMSTSCVMQDDETKTKRGFNSELIRPVFAIENPELSFGVSRYQTACGIVDIMMHTLERYFQPSIGAELADEFAIGLLRSVIEAGKTVMADPCDYQARATLMLASSWSHNGLTNIGKPFFMPAHQLEHALSGVYPEIAHGAGLAILFPTWASFFIEYHEEKLARLGKELFGIQKTSQNEAAREFIAALRGYFVSLGMPITLREAGISNPDFDALIDVLFADGKEEIVDNLPQRNIDRERARIIFESRR